MKAARSLSLIQMFSIVRIAAVSARANVKVPRQMGFGAGRERRRLFASHIEPFDLALTAKRVAQPV